MSEASRSNPLSRIFKALAKVEPNEQQATLLSFLWVFLVMCAYYILRPVRDELSSDWTNEQLSWLWTSTFVFSAVAISVYGAIISRVRIDRIVPAVYIFFALSFVGFYVAGATTEGNDWVNRTYYVWNSIFGLFHLSVFWTYMSGLYNKEQAKRLFGVIAVGAMTGAIAGSSFVVAFLDEIGNLNMLWVSAALLLTPLPIIARLYRLRATSLGNTGLSADASSANRLSINPFSGFGLLFSNRFLLWIGIFILLYVTISTFLYFEIRNPLGDLDQVRRAKIWASMDLLVNVLAAITALFATGRLATNLGMPKTLALIPAMMIIAWLVVAAFPLAMTVFAVQVIRRAGNYAVTRPGREMLFTLVDNESRYKAKPVIDTVVYRGGDVATAWFYTLIVSTFSLTLVGVSIVGAIVALLWVAVGIHLGRLFERDAAEVSEQ